MVAEGREIARCLPSLRVPRRGIGRCSHENPDTVCASPVTCQHNSNFRAEMRAIENRLIYGGHLEPAIQKA